MFTARILLLGSGELGKEFTISAKRLGAHVVACDSYAGAPAMQVADAGLAPGQIDAQRATRIIAPVADPFSMAATKLPACCVSSAARNGPAYRAAQTRPSISRPSPLPA